MHSSILTTPHTTFSSTWNCLLSTPFIPSTWHLHPHPTYTHTLHCQPTTIPSLKHTYSLHCHHCSISNIFGNEYIAFWKRAFYILMIFFGLIFPDSCLPSNSDWLLFSKVKKTKAWVFHWWLHKYTKGWEITSMPKSAERFRDIL